MLDVKQTNRNNRQCESRYKHNQFSYYDVGVIKTIVNVMHARSMPANSFLNITVLTIFDALSSE